MIIDTVSESDSEHSEMLELLVLHVPGEYISLVAFSLNDHMA